MGGEIKESKIAQIGDKNYKEVGIVYNVINDEGMNYVWDGEKWDALGRMKIDLSDYMKTDDIEPLSTIDLDVIMKSASSVDSFKALINAGGEFTLSNSHFITAFLFSVKFSQ